MRISSAWARPFFSETMTQSHLLSLVCLLLVRAFILVFAMLQSGIGLGPDEAQYWLWSQHLDWGYYSKPPGIAWEIYAGTHIFGDTVVGVRSGALIIGSLLPIALYVLAICCGLKATTAFWAGVVMAVSPVGILGSFLATTDAGYVLFWTLACAIVCLALRRGEKPNYRTLGFVLALGALFKWPIYLFWLLLLPFSFLATRLQSMRMLGGVAISLLGLLPSLIWNAKHDWVTFRHVSSAIRGAEGAASSGFFGGHFLAFLGAQVALFSPIFFGLLIGAIWIFLQRRRRLGLPLFFCGYITVAGLGTYLMLSLVHKMQGNWAVFAYPTAIILIVWFACEWLPYGKSTLFAGGLLSSVLTAFVFSIPTLQARNLASYLPIHYRQSPFRTNVGWENLEEFLREDGYDPEENFLVSDRYQTSSLLSRYSEGRKRSYLLNLGQARKNQFSVWPSLAAERSGQTGFFVYIDESSAKPEMQQRKVAEKGEQLADYFRTVEFVGAHPLYASYGQPVKQALVFRCCEYNRNLPADPNQY